MRWPLKYQIMLPMAAAMLASILALSGLNAYFAARRSAMLIERQVANVSETLAGSNFPLTEPVLRQMRGLSGAHFVLVNEDGSQVSSGGGMDAQNLPIAAAATRGGESLRFAHPISLGGRRYYHSVLALIPTGRDPDRQVLHVLYPEQAYRAAWQQAAQPSLVVGVISLAIVAIVALATASRLSRPLLRLREHLGRIAEGRFDPLPLPRSNDEVRDLVVSVNRMSQMLVSYEREVRATEQVRTLGHLVRGIAHQLRNSTTGAQMALDIHRNECSEGRQSESLDVAARQLALIEKYLQKFLSLDARVPRTSKRVDFCGLVEGLAPLLLPTARHMAVQLKFVVPDRPLVVDGDRDGLEHAILNLLLNALDAAGQGLTATGEMSVIAEVSAADDDRLRFAVEDNGAGPDPEIASSVFEPFVTNKPHGTGLGLSLAKDIIAAHRGSLRWERREGKTRFSFELPLV